MDSPGIVEWFGGGDSGHRCGYCKKSDTNMSDGMWAHSLTVQNYQDLIDRGWRRSGKYCYKPNMRKMCCPHYTIKCEALRFQMSKSHKKIIKQFNRYIIHGKKRGECSKKEGEEEAEMADVEVKPGNEEVAEEGSPVDPCDLQQGSSKRTHTPPEETHDQKQNNTDSHKKNKTPRSGEGADPTKPKCRKAKEIRKERKKAKLEQSENKSEDTIDASTKQEMGSTEKTLEEFLDEYKTAENCAHKFEIKLVRVNPKSDVFRKTYKETYKVFKAYQMNIHEETESDCDEETFKDFLVEGPLQEFHKEGGLPMGYGSFHQQYIIDGKIIAVGVIDILPHCTSSVYLYYDPDYNFLSLGTYTALQEIAFTRFLHKMDPALQYYYMGYYIHSCPKMRYKGQYHPSYLLCPETYTWQPIKECAPKLDKHNYARFAPEGEVDEDGEVDINTVGILFMRQAMTYELYKVFKKNASDQDQVKKYARFAGRKCTESMLLYRS